MNNIPNRQVVCQVLMELAQQDRDIMVLCSDSRGSASLAEFAKTFPRQFIEVGIAEQSLVSTAAGLAKCGKKPLAASPASFLTTRSFEQCKVDVAYSEANVKLLGISGGVSYGALGMTHHSAQDIAAMAAIPGMRVYLPSDRHQTRRLVQALMRDGQPAYIRVGRNPVEDVYTEDDCPFALNKATVLRSGRHIALVACGEMVRPALDAAGLLAPQGVDATVVDVHGVKPLDSETLLQVARQVQAVLTVEEHSPFGGLGSMVSQLVAAHSPRRVVNLALPDAPVITGTAKEVFAHYRMDAAGIAQKALEVLAHG